MSVLEWLFERRNPGPVGDAQFGQPEPDDDPEPPNRWVVWLTTIVGITLLGFCLYGCLRAWSDLSAFQLTWRLILLAIYLLLGHYVFVRPDYRNMGYLGGMFDNPFRFSDDANRTLAFFEALLFSGKLMAYGLVMAWTISRHYWRKYRNRRR